MNKKDIKEPVGIRIVEQASPIQVKGLLESFWGKDSTLANYSQGHVSFNEAQTLLTIARDGDQDTREAIRTQLNGKRISITAIDEDTEELVAHSSLLVSSNTVEAAGAIIRDSHRRRGILTYTNTYRKELLHLFGELGYTLTSFLVVGSPSVDYGHKLFNFPNLEMDSVFCNIGPYILKVNPEDISQQDPRFQEWSMKTSDGFISSTVQVVGIQKDKSPVVAATLIPDLPDATAELLVSLPHEFTQDEQTTYQNLHYATTANLDIYTLYQSVSDADTFLSSIKEKKISGRSVLVRIPLQKDAGDLLEEVNTMMSQVDDEYRLVPTGLTVVNGYWTGCYALMARDEIAEYRTLLQKLSKSYSGTLKDLAEVTLHNLK